VAMRFLNIIDIEANRLQSLISDILFLSKIEKMEMDMDKELFSLTNLTTEIIEIITPQATERNITIYFTPNQDILMWADASKIKQLILNLLSNAIKYNKDCGKIFVQESRLDERHVTIAISDNGIGMDKEDLERIFERFYCVDKGRSQKNGGTGLGLSIVKHIANLYDGKVNVESEPGKGSAFTVTLCVDGDGKKED
jgi:Signal transduction histidine kinase